MEAGRAVRSYGTGVRREGRYPLPSLTRRRNFNTTNYKDKTMTKIVHTNKGKSPHDDNLINLRDVPTVGEDQLQEIAKDAELGFFHITENEVYACNKLKFDDKYFVFIEPNPVAFYYSLAKGASMDFTWFRNGLRIFYEDKTKLNQSLQNELVLFSYIFKTGCAGVIFSFLAIEAFLNQLLPDYKPIYWKNKRHTKKKIQRVLSFKDKIENLIPQITGKDFKISFTADFYLISKLKELRDELTHLKNNKGKFLSCYTEIYQDILDLNLDELVLATKNFINFYYPDLIAD
jgi:hypothetical protein